MNYDNKKFFIYILCLGLLIFTSASSFFHFVVRGYYLEYSWPLNSFFEPAKNWGNDFFSILNCYKKLNPFEVANANNNPLGYNYFPITATLAITFNFIIDLFNFSKREIFGIYLIVFICFKIYIVNKIVTFEKDIFLKYIFIILLPLSIINNVE